MKQTTEADAGKPYQHGISFGEAFRVWLRVAVLSFGGPAGQIAVMHRILVEEKNWISESRFLHALNYCMLLPGPEAQQLATYIGWLLHRTAGGIMAGGLFILPGIIAIMGLSYVYAAYGNVGFVEASITVSPCWSASCAFHPMRRGTSGRTHRTASCRPRAARDRRRTSATGRATPP